MPTLTDILDALTRARVGEWVLYHAGVSLDDCAPEVVRFAREGFEEGSFELTIGRRNDRPAWFIARRARRQPRPGFFRAEA